MHKVFVTGGTSMIGSALVEQLWNSNKYTVVCPDKSQLNLLDLERTSNFLKHIKPDYCIHLAGVNGGIKENLERPVEIYYETTQIGMNVLKSCLDAGVKKVISLLSSCAYPNAEFIREGTLWDGLPHPTVECHALAKRSLHAFSRQISKEGKMLAVCCVANNSFGPKDRFNEGGKVISGMIEKFVNAKRLNLPEVKCWGTGAPLRSFIYCDDIASLLILCLRHFDDWKTPLNLGTDYEISIKELSELIAKITKYEGKIIWEVDKPDGQMRKFLENSRMRSLFPNFLPHDISYALQRTVDWYENNLGAE